MNIEEDPCTCGGPDYGVFGNANMCDFCRAQSITKAGRVAIADIERQIRRREQENRVSREFNSYMIELFNQRNK